MGIASIAGTAVVRNGNGDIWIGEVAGDAVVAQSAFGALEVGVRDGVAAWLDLDTRFGRVQNDLDSSDRPSASEDSVEVHARTSYGDITVHRSLPSRTGRGEA